MNKVKFPMAAGVAFLGLVLSAPAIAALRENMRSMQSAAVTEFLTQWKPAAPQ
jgi:hypothetical protein